MAKESNGTAKKMALLATIVTIVLTLGGIIWAMATQNTRLNTTCIEVQAIKPKVDTNDRRITILETRQTAIYEGVKRIEDKLDER